MKFLERVSAYCTEWYADNWNKCALGLVALAFVIRLYFLFETKGQTLWWDESEYGATALYLSEGVPYNLNPERPFLFPGVPALSFLIGLTEHLAKFFFSVIPASLGVLAMYELGKELFDKRVGLLAAFCMTVSWTFVFWSARLQPDHISMLFQLLAILCMWRYWKYDEQKAILFAGIFCSLAFQFKVSGLLVPMSFMVFMLFRERLTFVMKKEYWFFGGIFLVAFLPQLIYSGIVFDNPLALFTNTGYATVVLEEKPYGWYVLGFLYSLIEWPLFFFFVIGAIVACKTLLILDVLYKDAKKSLDPSLYSLIVLLVVALFYIFYIRGAEDRWVFLWLPFMFLLSAQSILFFFDQIKKRSVLFSGLFLLILLGSIGAIQLTHASEIIAQKEESYLPVKEAGKWLYLNSQSGVLVMTQSQPQTVYYAHRPISHLAQFKNATAFEAFIAEHRPGYLMVSLFEYHPEWVFPWIDNHQHLLKPVFVTYQDPEQTKPSLVLYQLTYETN